MDMSLSVEKARPSKAMREEIPARRLFSPHPLAASHFSILGVQQIRTVFTHLLARIMPEHPTNEHRKTHGNSVF
jgi:hypothetical protein